MSENKLYKKDIISIQDFLTQQNVPWNEQQVPLIRLKTIKQNQMLLYDLALNENYPNKKLVVEILNAMVVLYGEFIDIDWETLEKEL